MFVKSFLPNLLHGKAWQRDRRFEDANLFGLEQSGQPGGRRQDEFGLFGEMRAHQEALGHDCDILRSDNLAEQLLDVLMNVAQMPPVDQDMPPSLKSVQREASVGEMGSRYDTDILLRKEGMLDHARVESGEAYNGDDELARFEPREQSLASHRNGLEIGR